MARATHTYAHNRNAALVDQRLRCRNNLRHDCLPVCVGDDGDGNLPKDLGRITPCDHSQLHVRATNIDANHMLYPHVHITFYPQEGRT